jgi:hypothetical protein
MPDNSSIVIYKQDRSSSVCSAHWSVKRSWHTEVGSTVNSLGPLIDACYYDSYYHFKRYDPYNQLM